MRRVSFFIRSCAFFLCCLNASALWSLTQAEQDDIKRQERLREERQQDYQRQQQVDQQRQSDENRQRILKEEQERQNTRLGLDGNQVPGS